MSLKCISHNAKGLNSPTKRSLAFRHYSKLGADVLFLQETHFSDTSVPKYFHHSYQLVYTAGAEKKHRGVAIGIHKKLNFQPTTIKSDPEGRFLILVGQIQDTPITLATVYGPNEGQQTYYREFFSILEERCRGPLILAGDFNEVSHPNIDRQPSPVSIHNQKNKHYFAKLIDKYLLVDAWREQHPFKKDFTFFSVPHNSHSRIDMFLIHKQISPNTSQTKILSCPWSDHSIITLTLTSLAHKPLNNIWRLDDSLLSNPQHQQTIESELESYFTHNNTPDIASPTLWAAHKAYIRGILIQLKIKARKERTKATNWLGIKMQQLEDQLKTNPNDTKSKQELEKTKTELNLLLTEKEITNLQWTKQKFYRKANKADTMMARQLSNKFNKSPFTQIRLKDGSLTANPERITQEFATYYHTLYQKHKDPNPTLLQQFLNQANLPPLTPQQKTLMSEPISIEEIKVAIKQLKVNKSPGPDGFTGKYYKLFAPKLIPWLHLLFNDIMNNKGNFSRDDLQAQIAVIPKPEKDHTNCKNFRPISILNLDIKLLAKIIASRLNQFLGQLIHKDQSGFIPKRQVTDNIRKIINLIHIAKTKDVPSMLLSLDLEKAFDLFPGTICIKCYLVIIFLSPSSPWLRPSTIPL
eukprot:XP_017946520.1 PREDICTED: UDP-Gal:betaGlcNAc beta 1,4- galactosyltransferase, polypeptide 1, gene 1 isoform X1 [Xenopus tropicalis]